MVVIGSWIQEGGPNLFICGFGTPGCNIAHVLSYRISPNYCPSNAIGAVLWSCSGESRWRDMQFWFGDFSICRGSGNWSPIDTEAPPVLVWMYIGILHLKFSGMYIQICNPIYLWTCMWHPTSVTCSSVHGTIFRGDSMCLEVSEFVENKPWVLHGYLRIFRREIRSPNENKRKDLYVFRTAKAACHKTDSMI